MIAIGQMVGKPAPTLATGMLGSLPSEQVRHLCISVYISDTLK